MRLGGGEHERHKGCCGLFLLSLIGQDPLSLTFCTPSLPFHMLMQGQGRGGNTPELSAGGQRLLSLSLPPFHAISPLFLPLPLSSNLTDFGVKGSECSVDRKGGDGIVAVTRATCEDQVHCSDPRPCLCGHIF